MAVDEEGLELRDLDAAQRDAAQSLGAMFEMRPLPTRPSRWKSQSETTMAQS